MTEGASSDDEYHFADNQEFQNSTPEELGLKAPCILIFMPTKDIFQKLIRRATQIKDAIGQLNPGEEKNDPRKIAEGDEDVKKIGLIHG